MSIRNLIREARQFKFCDDKKARLIQRLADVVEKLTEPQAFTTRYYLLEDGCVREVSQEDGAIALWVNDFHSEEQICEAVKKAYASRNVEMASLRRLL